MEISPEMQAQIAEQKKQCVYCKIVSGEMQGKTAYEDNMVLAVLDIYPAKKGHTVYALKEHYPLPAYVPPDQFSHYFGLVPALCGAVKEGIVSTGVNLFVASGGAAGQQFPHFLAHIFPREKGDEFFNFDFKKGQQLDEKSAGMLANNLPIMMNNHFGRNPASWHTGTGEKPEFLSDIYENSKLLYEDEKALCVLAQKSAVSGHIEIYSKEEEHYIENLSIESSFHLFFVASFAATAVFEGLGAHGTNIIMKSGESDDNPGGRLTIHVLPRKMEDGLSSMMWQGKQPNYDLDGVKSRIKDKTWKINLKDHEKEVKDPYKEPEVVKIVGQNGNSTKKPKDEIQDAIRNL
jgi:histidine triad (HIT) family protein